jgi:hypothetical protein
MRPGTALTGAALGVFTFLISFDPRLADPANFGWMMDGDAIWHFLGWHFFRYADWSWPLGTIASLSGGAEGGSIVYTDSIPLLALLLKPLSSFIPAVIQYHGAWTLICYALQGWFAWRIVAPRVQHPWLRLEVVGILCLSPILLVYSRQGLGAHWLVLAGLWLCLRPELHRHLRNWSVLTALAVLVHAYLAAMVFALFLADLTQRRLATGQLDTRGAALSFAGVSAVAGVTAWAAGYFVVGEHVVANGFGTWSLNPLGLFLPHTPHPFGFFLPQHALAQGQLEGFSDLGVGVLVLLPVWALLLARRGLAGLPRRHLPLTAAALLLTLFALSNRITLGPWDVLGYPLPESLLALASTFRASARMVWPAYYLICLGVLLLVARRLPVRTALPLLALALALQGAETWHAAREIRSAYFEPVAKRWSQPFRSPFWQQASATRADLLLVPPRTNPDVPALGVMAAPLGYGTNVFFFNRVDVRRQMAAEDRLMREVLTGHLRTDALYLLFDEPLRDFLGVLLGPNDGLGQVDGVTVAAAGVANRRSLLPPSRIPRSTPSPVYSIPLGERVPFAAGGSGVRHLAAGFSSPEDWGVWSEGASAAMLFCLTEPPHRELTLALEVTGFTPAAEGRPSARVLLNGAATLPDLLATPGAVSTYTATIRADQLRHQCLALALLIPEPRSPAELGLGEDRRRLGVGLISAALF